MESVFIFFIWLIIAVLGIVISVKKKAAQQEAAGQKAGPKQWNEDMDRNLREVHEQMIHRQPAEEKVAEEGTLESEAVKAAPKVNTHEAAVKPAPATAQAPKPAPSKEMDFDPEQMIVYSEIMKPGYEKY